MNGTSELAPTFSASLARGKLCRMLRSMSRRWPQTSLRVTTAGFGALRADGSYLHIGTSGDWTDADMRDFLALFVTWLAVDPDRLRKGSTYWGGASQTAAQD